MMTANFRKLEKQRIDKIRNLNQDEIKAYIDNLNKKVFESFEANDKELADHYQKKIVEAFDVTSDKWVNLDFYSLNGKLDLSITKLIEGRTKEKAIEMSLHSQILIYGVLSLSEALSQMNNLLSIYYWNYASSDFSLVEDLLMSLEFEYDFRDDNFSKYANSKCKKYNDTLMKQLDFQIAMLKTSMLDTIAFLNIHAIDDYSAIVDDVFSQVKKEKDYVIAMADKDSRFKLLKDGGYLDLLMTLSEAYKSYGESCREYFKIKDDVLELLNSHDGFADIKEFQYKMYCEDFENMSLSKEDFFASRPCFDLSEVKFIASDE